jgi:uncharacterized protein involved in response to NO
MGRIRRLLGTNAEGTDSAAYIICGVAVAASAIHIYLLRYWPGWRYNPRPSVFAYAVQFVPVAALFICIGAAALNRIGFGRLALRIAFWFLIPTLCVLALDGCVGTIGMVD